MPSVSAAQSISLTSVYHIGDLVIHEPHGLRAFITEVQEEERTCTLRYELDGNIEEDVPLQDVKHTTLTQTSTRSGVNRHISSLPPTRPTTDSRNDGSSTRENRELRNEQQQQVQNDQAHLRQLPNNLPTYEAIKTIMKESLMAERSNNAQPPLLQILQAGLQRPKGWMRDVIRHHFENVNNIPNERRNTSTHLMGEEVEVLCMVSALLNGYLCNNAGPLICHAFAISKNSRKRIFTRYISNDFVAKRKERNDKGTSVFKDEKKRKHTYTALNIFKKKRMREFRETSAKIPHATLKAEFDALTPDQKEAYEILAQADLERSRTLWDELTDFLLKTKGKVPYAHIEIQLGFIVSKATIMKILKQQEGFYLRKDRILPSLSQAAKFKRVVWAELFWYFWRCAACCPVEDIQFVSLHMDEKWFHAIRTRCNCKVLTSIGLDQADYYAHHKNYVGKCMYIVVTAYVPFNNDITKGGIAVPVACIRAGRMIRAQKNTYKRVYAADGTYTMPAIPENQLRHEGQYYFKSLEVTGSTLGTEKNPKVSLLHVYREEIIPAIEEKIVRRFSNNGTRKVCIVRQEDGAGPHNDGTYQYQMKEEFAARDWLLFDQPPQSPVTNVHDACIFPMMSKKVSVEQAVSFRSTLLRPDQLHQTVMKVWEDKTNIISMARAFAAQPQIACAILEHEGDNDYLSEKGGLSFGVRRTYHCTEDGEGVFLSDVAPQNANETVAQRIINERRAKGLKYTPPDLRTLGNAQLTDEMISVLAGFIDEGRMPDDVREVWTRMMLEDEEISREDGRQRQQQQELQMNDMLLDPLDEQFDWAGFGYGVEENDMNGVTDGEDGGEMIQTS